MSPRPFHEDDGSVATVHQVTEPSGLVSAFAFTVTDGTDQGLSFILDAERLRLLIGQSPSCEVRLRDPAVSRRHAAFEIDGATVRVSDLESTNGTWVNGVSVTLAQLRGGERVQ